MEIVTAAIALVGFALIAAMPPISAIDPAWAIPLNTALWVFLAFMNKRTESKAAEAASHAEVAAEAANDARAVVADTRRIVKEAHNATMDTLDNRDQVLAKKYQDHPDPDSGRFLPVEPEGEKD